MTSHQEFRDNLKPHQKASILDAYVSAHSPERVEGYLDAVRDLIQYVQENILTETDGSNHFRTSPNKVRTMLNSFCNDCMEMVNIEVSKRSDKLTSASNDNTILSP